MMLFITTSNAVFAYEAESGRLCTPVPWRYRKGCLARLFHRSIGFFGITRHERSGKLLIASRERFGTPACGKPSTDACLLALDPRTLKYDAVATIRDVHDVHQIAAVGDVVFITDTGKNRLLLWDLARNRLLRIINIGETRQDINHINALRVYHGKLLIGFNNNGHTNGQVMSVELRAVLESDRTEIEATVLGAVVKEVPFRITHDLLPYRDTLLACDSKRSVVFRIDDESPLLSLQPWLRGLAATDEGLWVGISDVAERHKRHSHLGCGLVKLFSHDMSKPKKVVELKGSGQVNDLLAA